MGESDTHPAEQRLLEALRMDGVCDLIPGNLVPDRDDILGWDDPDRVIRFETLRSLLLRVHPELRPRSIRLRGAIITGGIELQGAVIDPALVLEKCRVDDRADFRQATFTATASFEVRCSVGRLRLRAVDSSVTRVFGVFASQVSRILRT